MLEQRGFALSDARGPVGLVIQLGGAGHTSSVADLAGSLVQGFAVATGSGGSRSGGNCRAGGCGSCFRGGRSCGGSVGGRGGGGTGSSTGCAVSGSRLGEAATALVGHEDHGALDFVVGEGRAATRRHGALGAGEAFDGVLVQGFDALADTRTPVGCIGQLGSAGYASVVTGCTGSFVGFFAGFGSAAGSGGFLQFDAANFLDALGGSHLCCGAVCIEGRSGVGAEVHRDGQQCKQGTEGEHSDNRQLAVLGRLGNIVCIKSVLAHNVLRAVLIGN